MDKKISTVLLIMALAACILWTGLRYLESEETGGQAGDQGISRALAVKSLALGIAEKENCRQAAGGYFAAENSSYWYVPYYNYLYQTEIMSPDQFLPEPSNAAAYLTVQEAASLWNTLGLKEMAEEAQVSDENADKPVSAAFWWKGYQAFLDKYNYSGKVQEKKLVVYATRGNASSDKWKASTSQGTFGFEGLSMDANVDQVLRVWVRGDEILRIVETLQEDVAYRNIWISRSDAGSLTALVGGVSREFLVEGVSEVETPCLADLILRKGKVQKIRVKSEEISAKVLAVREEGVELEGYGLVPYEDYFQAYHEGEAVSPAGKENIITGSSNIRFFAEDGKLCGALIGETQDPVTIRVLLENTDFSSYFHPAVELSSRQEIKMISSTGEEQSYPAGTKLRYDVSSQELQAGNRLVIQAQGGEVEIPTIGRYQGTPSYGGTLELKLTEQGIVIVNEVTLEDYLKKVVGSEMPARYGLEAAKLQAVCARSYACRQIEENACREYGAHVTDSTEFQVYNNFAPDPVSIQGVEETEGEVLRYGTEIIAAYYFSTSCGYTTDASVWGSETDAYPYLQSQQVRPFQDAETAEARIEQASRLQYESNFRSWMQESAESYEGDCQWYRWSTEEKLPEIQKRLENLQSAGKAARINIGTLKQLEVQERAPGGAVTVLQFTGDSGSVRLEGQSAIRAALGDMETVYQTNIGKESSGERDILPSAFFYLEEIRADGGVIGYRIKGGGSGHGVGMSQNGAHGMIKAGMNYRQILEYFYPGTKLEKLA